MFTLNVFRCRWSWTVSLLFVFILIQWSYKDRKIGFVVRLVDKIR